jgi:hypothetical protein
MTFTNYKLHKDSSGKVSGLHPYVDGTLTKKICIPLAEGNTDYAEYLEWVAAGNTVEAAD